MKRNPFSLPLTACIACSLSPGLLAKVEKVEPLADGATLTLSEGHLQVKFVTDGIARVRVTRNDQWSDKESLMRVAVEESPGEIKVDEKDGFIELKSGQLVVRIDRVTEAVSYLTREGEPLLTEDPRNPRAFEKVDVIKSIPDPDTVKKVQTVDGEREIVGKYVQGKDREAWKGTVSFEFSDDEALYGLGFDETSDLNLRGTTKRLYQHNLRILVPSLVSTRGYGLLFDAYSAMTFADGPESGSMSFDVIDDLDYYFIYGPDMNGAVAGYRQLTGEASMLPRWAYGYVQSKERYKTQEELIDTVKEFRKREIPLDVIVQDWNYWLQWGGDVDKKRYPNIAKMTREIHDLNAHVMISIWPNPSDQSVAGKALKEAGYMLAGSANFNPFDPKSRELYWKTVAWEPFGQHGMDGWWCDSTEPENADWQKDRPADEDAANIAGLAKVIDPQLLNAYGLMDAVGIYENQRKDMPDKRVLNLTRSGYAGGQRTGAMLWTGDTTASWDTLAQQLVALQSISAAGYPHITMDAGAFFVASKSQWFWKGQYNKGCEDLGYRELYTRWLQAGVFLPMFRSHGTDTPREPWRFGEPGTPFYDAILASIDLRYRLLPYFYSLAGRVSLNDDMFLRPLAFAFPEDEKAHDLKTQFLVGDAFMVAPVLAPQHYGPDSQPIEDAPEAREVYLPEGAAWIDFWSGRQHSGGQTIQAEAPLSQIPLFVKSGSIVPMGPHQQFTGEKPDAPIELRVYPGADGTFTFYEDEGDGYGYEKGAFATIPIAWNEETKTLTLGARRGAFPGMAKQRTFRVILVSEDRGTGSKETEKPDAVIRYTGTATTFTAPTKTD